jgi:hypothetical protein
MTTDLNTLPHLTTDDHAGDFVVHWPNTPGDDAKAIEHFPTAKDAAKEIRWQMYEEFTIGSDICGGL